MNCKSPAVFHESDYHTPPPRNRRRRRILERKSTACMCACFSVFLVIVIAFGIAVGLRVTGTRDLIEFDETLGDTRLVHFDPSYCRKVELSTGSAPATMYLLHEKPPLTGWSNITFFPSFVITEYKEYVDDYGWYDYGDLVYVEDIDYVTWNFHLNKGSEIYVDACIDTTGTTASFILIKGKSNYINWQDGDNSFENHVTLQPCSTAESDGSAAINRKVSNSDEYYFVFFSPSDNDLRPRINLTLALHRTEYVVDSNSTGSSCTTEAKSKNCLLSVHLHGQTYTLIQTSSKETGKVKFGEKVRLMWICHSRSWVYVLIFFCPVVFFASLFTAMYCVITMFWNRKIKSYETLREGIASEENSAIRIVYEHPEKKSINVIS